MEIMYGGPVWDLVMRSCMGLQYMGPVMGFCTEFINVIRLYISKYSNFRDDIIPYKLEVSGKHFSFGRITKY